MSSLTAVETINSVLRFFEKGEFPQMLELIADQIDFRIDHFQDPTDVSWQVASHKGEFVAMLGRLGQEVFPRGTQILQLNSRECGDGWAHTELQQEFFYGVQGRVVTSRSFILLYSQSSHPRTVRLLSRDSH